jgi:IS30 family transposase
MEPYKQKDWLYEHYVKKRMNLTDICKRLKESYNIEVTPQAIYNWVKKYDLLKYRGKGRNLSSTSMRRPKSPMQEMVEKKRREMRKVNQARKKGKKL